jgi:pre-rRNA-processing protein TSR3
MTFLRARADLRFDATGFVQLAIGAPPLTAADRGRALLLLDATWRWLPQLEACVTGTPIRRSIPGALRTAYPRKSKVFDDPCEGLASVEALYVARRLLGDDDPSLLDGYHWRDEFLAIVRAAADDG